METDNLTGIRRYVHRCRALASGKAVWNQRGMTLVEIMIVVTIMASIMGVVAWYTIGYLRQANVKETKAEVARLKGMVDTYYTVTDPHEFPDSLEQLKSPHDGSAPLVQKIPKDPWGNDYVYQVDGEGYILYSTGPDGQDGTADDIGRDDN